MVNAFIEPIINTAIALAIGALVVRAIDAIIERVTTSKSDELTKPENEEARSFYTTLSAIRRFMLVILLVVGVAFVLISSKIDQTLGFSLLASAGAIGLIVAFAAREALGNIMASLQIAFARTARIGDAVHHR